MSDMFTNSLLVLSAVVCVLGILPAPLVFGMMSKIENVLKKLFARK